MLGSKAGTSLLWGMRKLEMCDLTSGRSQWCCEVVEVEGYEQVLVLSGV